MQVQRELGAHTFGEQQAEPLAWQSEAGISQNERLVLSLIRRRGALAGADIARASGLSAQTVSVIMRGLERQALLLRGEPQRGKVGQPSVPMRLAEGGAYFIGMKVGRRSVELVLTNFVGAVLAREIRVHPFPTPQATQDFALEAIGRLVATLPEAAQRRVVGLGIAMPFFLWNWAETLGVPVADMAAWRQVDLTAELRARLPFPVYLCNDASAACAAEVVFGPADTPSDFLYFYMGYFVGGGVVLGGALFSGAGNAGAIGSMPVPTAQGPKPLLDVASLSQLERRLVEAGQATGAMWEEAEAWRLDPDLVDDWLDEAAEGLAHAIAAACSVMDFRHVIIDGWIPRQLCARLVAAVGAALERHNFTGLARPSLRQGTAGADARTLGAASLPLSDRFLVEAARAA